VNYAATVRLIMPVLGHHSPAPESQGNHDIGGTPRCQRSRVAGLTRKVAHRSRLSSRASVASNARSAGEYRGRATWRRSTANWWRSTAISTSFSSGWARAGSGRAGVGRHQLPRRDLADQPPSRAPAASGAHPFTAPANRPRTRYFCRKKNMSAMGIMVSNEAPSLRGNWLPEDRPPFTRLARPVVSV
jgi:hypothetical protein